MFLTDDFQELSQCWQNGSCSVYYSPPPSRPYSSVLVSFCGDKHSLSSQLSASNCHQIIKHDQRHPLTLCSLSNVCLSLVLVTELKETLTQEAGDVFQSVKKWIPLSWPTISCLLCVYSSWTATLFRLFHGWKHVTCLSAALFMNVSMRLMLLAQDTQCCESPDS